MQLFRRIAPVFVLLTLVGCATTPSAPDIVKQSSPDAVTTIGNADVGERISLPDGNSLGQSDVVVGRSYAAASGRTCRRLQSVEGAPLSRVVCRVKDGTWQYARDLQPVSSLQNDTGRNKQALALVPRQRGVTTTALVTDSVVATESSETDNSILMLNPDGSVSRATFDVMDASTQTGGAAVVIDDSALYSDDAVTGTVESTALSNDPDNTVVRELQANETLWKFARRTTGNALNWTKIAETNGITDTMKIAPGAKLAIPSELIGNGG